ncbi:MAG: hypothetical protein SPE55_02130, partial [Sodaliphilus sp.]|nr:hypothetical protein [Sodaliphilus sp.]
MDIREKSSNENRLIDANEYCMELYNEMNYPGRSEEFMTAIDVAIADLADAPTVDAVEVVRKPVVGYEGYYEVDQFGRVFSV